MVRTLIEYCFTISSENAHCARMLREARVPTSA